MSRTAEHAVSFTAVETAELVEVPREETPLGPTEVAGRTLTSLISPGTELAGYRSDPFPRMTGYAAVFRVDKVGRDVRAVHPSDRVFCMGPHRSFQRADEADVTPLPTGLAPETAVFARLMGVSMTTLATTTARPPARVVVTGLGPVGYLAAQIFAACGYEVLACDPVAARRGVARAAGIGRVTAAPPLDDPLWAGQTALVVECSGHEQAVVDGCHLVQKRGEVVLVGVPWQRRTALTAHDVLHAVFHRYVVLRSGWEWELPLRPTEFHDGSIWGHMAAALRWLAEGRIRVEGAYGVMSPRDCQAAYQALAHRPGTDLTIVFDWGRLADG